MSNLEAFKSWHEKAKEDGLVDIKFFPGSNRDTSPEQFAQAVLEAVSECQNIGNIDLHECPEDLVSVFE